jgi:chemotaxis protein methyltransferase CheR
MLELKEAPVIIRADNYRFLQEQIRKQSGIVLDDTKHYLVEARLLPIALEEGLSNLDELCAKLRQSAPARLQRRVTEAMTTNETYFFREPAHFEALKNTILPPLLAERRESRKLSIWSAAASTGQEAYSLAMLLTEMGLQDWDLNIVGTDLAENVLEKAREGKYSQLEINRGLPVTMLVKHFTRQQLLWELKPAMRKMVRFQALDLRNINNSIGPFDIVLCRNVLIYFDVDTKRQIVDQIRTIINPGGHFFLGASEVGLSVGPRFARLCSNEATYYQAV